MLFNPSPVLTPPVLKPSAPAISFGNRQALQSQPFPAGQDQFVSQQTTHCVKTQPKFGAAENDLYDGLMECVETNDIDRAQTLLGNCNRSTIKARAFHQVASSPNENLMNVAVNKALESGDTRMAIFLANQDVHSSIAYRHTRIKYGPLVNQVQSAYDREHNYSPGKEAYARLLSALENAYRRHEVNQQGDLHSFLAGAASPRFPLSRELEPRRRNSDPLSVLLQAFEDSD